MALFKSNLLLPVLVLVILCALVRQIPGVFGDDVASKFSRKYNHIIEANPAFTTLKDCYDDLGEDINTRENRLECLGAALLGQPTGSFTYNDYVRAAHSKYKFSGKIGHPCSKLDKLKRDFRRHIDNGVIPVEEVGALDLALSVCRLARGDNQNWH